MDSKYGVTQDLFCFCFQAPCEFRLPLPMVTVLQSGRAAPGKSNCIKEYMIVPKPGKDLKDVRVLFFTFFYIYMYYKRLCKKDI